MRLATSTTALLISLAFTASAAPLATKLSQSLENPQTEVPEGAPGIVGDGLSGAGEAKHHRVRAPKGGKKGGAAGATGGALELAGAITSAAGAGKVGEALSAAGAAVGGKKGGGGKGH